MNKLDYPDRPPASPAMTDPIVALAVGIVKQDLIDLTSKDPEKRWDAKLWLAKQGAKELLEFVGITVDPLKWDFRNQGARCAERKLKNDDRRRS